MRLRWIVLTWTVCLLVVAGAHAEETTPAANAAAANIAPGPHTADWESLYQHNEAPEWFRDAKFGIYFHWGVYSVPAFGSEWYPRNMHFKNRREYQHHLDTYGDPAEFGYHDFVPRFTAEHFDAAEWVDLFEKAGARFAGPVAEHHDGFSMWASELTPWNAKEMGPRRDITGEIAAELRKRNMRLVTSFHHARNNQHQVNGNWTGHYPRVEGWPTTSEDPKLRMLYGNLPREEFLDLWRDKLIEVIDNYQPDLIWFDSWLHEIPDDYKTAFLAHYFNRADAWGKDVAVTFKQDDLPREVALDDFEKGRLDRLTDYAWLTDDTISKGSWCYTEGLAIKDSREVIHVLIDIVSKNGCLLLNISPKADGTIPEVQRNVLLDMGRWLDQYGEAIYETRPWVTFGEGPTRLKKAGHFVGSLDYTAQDIRFTAKGDTLYAIVLGRPEKSVTITSLAADSGLYGGEVTSVSLLGCDEPLPIVMTEDGLRVTMPKQVPDEVALVLKIEGLAIVGFEPDRSIHVTDGRAVLGAESATLTGPGIAVERKDNGRPNIGFWDDPTATASRPG